MSIRLALEGPAAVLGGVGAALRESKPRRSHHHDRNDSYGGRPGRLYVGGQGGTLRRSRRLTGGRLHVVRGRLERERDDAMLDFYNRKKEIAAREEMMLDRIEETLRMRYSTELLFDVRGVPER